MTSLTPVHVVPALRRLMFALILSLLPLAGSVLAQQESRRSATDSHTPVGLSPGAPAGTYSLSGFDNVNLFNGNLNFHLPLLKVGGRGAAGYTMMLPIEQQQQWRLETKSVQFYYGGGSIIYIPQYNWWNSLKPFYGPGVLQGRKTGDPLSCRCNYNYTLTQMSFTAPDGTEYDLRDQLNQGAPGFGQEACGCGPGMGRGKVFNSTDGSAVTFVAEYDISDAGGDETVANNGYELFLPSGVLLMPDGTRYRIDVGRVSWIRDRNGNRVTFTYDTFSRVKTITDSLGRTVTVNYDVQDAAPYGLCDQITYTGFGGASRTIRVSKANLGSALRAGQTLRSFGSLFPEVTADSTTFNPRVTTTVWLPDGRTYWFRYDSYGGLARVELPTGGAYEYDWAAGATNAGTSGAVMLWTDPAPDAIYRRVVERRVYSSGATLEGRATFSRPESRAANGTFPSVGYVVAEQFSAAGARLSASRHYFHGTAINSLVRTYPRWPTWKEGREWQTEALAADGATVLTRVTNTWQQRAWLSWAGQNDDAPAVDPRIVQTVTTVEPSGANLVAKKDMAYDASNNLTDSWEYDFGAGAPGPLLRHTRTDYVTLASYADHTGRTCAACRARTRSTAWSAASRPSSRRPRRATTSTG